MREIKQDSGASEKWDSVAIQKIQKIQDKIQAGKKLTKLEETKLEEYDNTHATVEFSLIIGLNQDFSSLEIQKIVDVCIEAVRKIGYYEVDMSGGEV
jgi:hypothetical protein